MEEDLYPSNYLNMLIDKENSSPCEYDVYTLGDWMIDNKIKKKHFRDAFKSAEVEFNYYLFTKWASGKCAPPKYLWDVILEATYGKIDYENGNHVFERDDGVGSDPYLLKKTNKLQEEVTALREQLASLSEIVRILATKE